MIIAFTGTSGSGKTTVIDRLKKWDFLKRKKLVAKNEDDFLTFKVIKFFLGDKLFTKYKEGKFFNQKEASVGSRLFSFLVYWFYPLVIYFEFLWLHLVYSMIFKNRVLLSDRYIYDYIVTFKEVLNIYNPVVKILLENFPKPHLCFYLKISKKVAFERNKNSIEGKITALPSHHEKVVGEYDRLALKHKLLTVSGESNVQHEAEEVKHYIYAKSKLSVVRSISISGIDGAGKTTACKSLNELANNVGIPSKVVHFYHVSIWHKLFKNPGCSQTKAKIQANRSFLWALLTFIDSYMQYFYFRTKNATSLVIFDRYFYDYSVSFEYRKVPHHEFFNKLIIRFGKSIVLLIDPVEARKRTPDDLPIEYFNNTHALYAEMAREQKLSVIQVNEKKPGEIVEGIIESI